MSLALLEDAARSEMRESISVSVLGTAARHRRAQTEGTPASQGRQGNQTPQQSGLDNNVPSFAALNSSLPNAQRSGPLRRGAGPGPGPKPPSRTRPRIYQSALPRHLAGRHTAAPGPAAGRAARTGYGSPYQLVTVPQPRQAAAP